MDSIAAAVFLMEGEAQRKRCLRVERKILRDSCNPFDLDDKAFVKNFRLNKRSFKYVLDIVTDVLGPSNKNGVTALGHVVCTMRFLAEGGYQLGVGKDQEVGMSQATVSIKIKRCLDIMEEKLCSQWVTLHMSNVEKVQAKMDFFSRTRFPGVIMCVDGTHIKILPPSEEKFLYFNRKGFYSINAMLMCDSKMRIRCVDARYPGSNHDSHIWKMSDAMQHLKDSYREGERNTWILGDAGYPLQPWLMTPFRSPVPGSPESSFNTVHGKARNIMERTIGLLKNRFRCILGARQLHYSPQKAGQIINVCCALHNICLHYQVEEPYIESLTEEDEEETNNIEQNEQGNYLSEASRIRQNIVQNL